MSTLRSSAASTRAKTTEDNLEKARPPTREVGTRDDAPVDIEVESDGNDDEGLDEITAPAPEQNPEEADIYRHQSLEEKEQERDRRQASVTQSRKSKGHTPSTASRTLREAHIYCNLILFSILGVLARLGLQALTIYPGAPVANTDLWANVAGSLIMGYLREDRTLYQHYWKRAHEEAHDGDDAASKATQTAKESYAAAKKTIPSYIGLSVGFCGCFTTFASACRDVYLAISNDLNTSQISNFGVSSTLRGRSAGYSVMAALGVVVLEFGLSIVALQGGSHLAIGIDRLTAGRLTLELENVINTLAIVLGPGVWLGSIFLTIWCPYNHWRGQVLFSLVFAPVGCVLRYQLSLKMNRLLKTFPLGTFAANVLGSCFLGMAYDLQHSTATQTLVGCQVLQGIEDGFCGALTTVSTFVLELDTLRLRHAYIYGVVSITVACSLLVVIMGSLQWTRGFEPPLCGS